MNTKNLLVSFVAIALVAFLAASVSAANFDVTQVKIDGVNVEDNPVLVAGDTVLVEVEFTSADVDKDVTVTVTLDTGKKDVEASSTSFKVATDGTYKKNFKLTVPNELSDDLEDLADLEITIEGDEYEDSFVIEDLLVERAQYATSIKSISVPSSVEAGESFPVDLVIKNTGYYDLDDMYVTVKIPALNIEKSAYFGDLVADESSTENEDDDDATDTVSGRILLSTPYSAEAGIYTVEVEVTNDDSTSNVVKEIVVKNDFANNVVVSSTSKTASVSQDAVYSLLVINPTDKLKVYKVVAESLGDVSVSADESVVAVPAGSSKAVSITANAAAEGEYSFDVSVFSGSELVGTSTLDLKVEGKQLTSSPIVVLTVVLAIIFLVLLVVLIVLITKKPEKSEEFGESYY